MLCLVDADPVAAGSLLIRDVLSELITAVVARYPDDNGLVKSPAAVGTLRWRRARAAHRHDAIQDAVAQHAAEQATETLGQLCDRIGPLDLS